MDELEAKVRLFEAIASNSNKLCDGNHYMKPYGVANYVNEVYEILTKKGEQ